MYSYLIGCFILGAIWLTIFLFYKEFRKPMIFSGLAYMIILTIGFISLKILSLFTYVGGNVIPDYWNPNTLFNLGRITGGYAIEDLLFMFFVAGIAFAIFHVINNKGIVSFKTGKHHYLAIIIACLVAGFVALFIKPNPIYTLITFGLAGSIIIWIQRKDLFFHSIVGGCFMAVIYFASFLLFNLIFPGFIQGFYNFNTITGILFLGVPLEELLYSLSFGMMWAPFYEYLAGKRDKNIRSVSRTVSKRS